MSKLTSEQKITFYTGACAPFLLVILPILLMPLTLWRAWVVVHLWNWYVAPGDVWWRLPLGTAFGICLLWTLLTPTFNGKEAASIWSSLSKAVIVPAMFLLVGWVGNFWL